MSGEEASGQDREIQDILSDLDGILQTMKDPAGPALSAAGEADIIKQIIEPLSGLPPVPAAPPPPKPALSTPPIRPVQAAPPSPAKGEQQAPARTAATEPRPSPAKGEQQAPARTALPSAPPQAAKPQPVIGQPFRLSPPAAKPQPSPAAPPPAAKPPSSPTEFVPEVEFEFEPELPAAKPQPSPAKGEQQAPARTAAPEPRPSPAKGEQQAPARTAAPEPRPSPAKGEQQAPARTAATEPRPSPAKGEQQAPARTALPSAPPIASPAAAPAPKPQPAPPPEAKPAVPAPSPEKAAEIAAVIRTFAEVDPKVANDQIRTLAFLHAPGQLEACVAFAKALRTVALKVSKKPLHVRIALVRDVPPGEGGAAVLEAVKAAGAAGAVELALGIPEAQAHEIEEAFSKEDFFLRAVTPEQAAKRTFSMDLAFEIMLLKAG
ncbi:MAG: hypothetical protein HY922_15870 [Elusimicrobia bacterium]|nr:hypothetical protein [Elusimicrobiota bacterium]